MTDAQNKRPGVAFWATVVAVVVLVYPLSFGPACWITSRADCGKGLLPVVYRPILKSMSSKYRDDFHPPEHDFWGKQTHGTLLGNDSLWWYAKIGAREGACWFYTVSYENQKPGFVTREEWKWQ